MTGQDDEVAFKRKMNALQRFLYHGMSRFSLDTWHHALATLHHASHPHPHRDPPLPGQPALRGVGDLRALSRDVMMQREGGALGEAEAGALKYLDHFLAALLCVREAKACVSGLYTFLHR